MRQHSRPRLCGAAPGRGVTCAKFNPRPPRPQGPRAQATRPALSATVPRQSERGHHTDWRMNVDSALRHCPGGRLERKPEDSATLAGPVHCGRDWKTGPVFATTHPTVLSVCTKVHTHTGAHSHALTRGRPHARPLSPQTSASAAGLGRGATRLSGHSDRPAHSRTAFRGLRTGLTLPGAGAPSAAAGRARSTGVLPGPPGRRRPGGRGTRPPRGPPAPASWRAGSTA